MMKRTTLLFLCAGLLFSLHALGFKKYAGEFLYLGAGARGTALGGAYTALVNDAGAAYWNPAALTDARGFQLQFMNSKQFINSIQTNYLSISHPYNATSTLAVSLYIVTVNNIKNTASAGVYDPVTAELIGLDESRVKDFNTGDYVLSVAYGHRLDDHLSWGVTLKSIYRDFDFTDAAGFGLDAAALYRLEDLRISAILYDATGTLIAWNEGEKELVSPTLGMGVAYTLTIPAWEMILRPALDTRIMGEGRSYAALWHVGPVSMDVMTGLELDYNDVVKIRAGLDALQRFNGGIGLKLPKISFDYAFTAYAGELGNVHRINVNLNLNRLF
ncbi:MAG: hypothetical protein D6677_10845 [Calditrichaeota bacterium]|nr:MAG: hypothetical protein D6677_10845 [Calditrichota bacterium]